MSKVFYDDLIVLEEVEEQIKSSVESSEEREELYNVVDEIVHHRVLEIILDHLPQKHHETFLEKFHETPHDYGLLEYLNKKVEKNMEEIIKQEIGGLAFEILQDIKGEEKEE
jgi:hypothetical protein